MAIFIYCNHCKSSLKIKDEYAGKIGICPNCGNAIRIATPSEETVRGLPRPATQEQKDQARSLGIAFDERITYKDLHQKIEEALEAQTEILGDAETGS
jgi:DNA-directed RNA polymerase subunit M/transcription elongation factor TFIIS